MSKTRIIIVNKSVFSYDAVGATLESLIAKNEDIDTSCLAVYEEGIREYELSERKAIKTNDKNFVSGMFGYQSNGGSITFLPSESKKDNRSGMNVYSAIINSLSEYADSYPDSDLEFILFDNCLKDISDDTADKVLLSLEGYSERHVKVISCVTETTDNCYPLHAIFDAPVITITIDGNANAEDTATLIINELNKMTNGTFVSKDKTLFSVTLNDIKGNNIAIDSKSIIGNGSCSVGYLSDCNGNECYLKQFRSDNAHFTGLIMGWDNNESRSRCYQSYMRERNVLHDLNNIMNIPMLIAYGECGNTFYIAQEFVTGFTLSQTLDELKVTKPNANELYQMLQPLLTSLCDTLGTMHKNHYVHGDLHIDNIAVILESDNKLYLNKLVDFGQTRPYGFAIEADDFIHDCDPLLNGSYAAELFGDALIGKRIIHACNDVYYFADLIHRFFVHIFDNEANNKMREILNADRSISLYDMYAHSTGDGEKRSLFYMKQWSNFLSEKSVIIDLESEYVSLLNESFMPKTIQQPHIVEEPPKRAPKNNGAFWLCVLSNKTTLPPVKQIIWRRTDVEPGRIIVVSED